jgi:hypothetical protein
MGNEHMPAGAEQPKAELQFDDFGSLPDEHMMSLYGMSSEEGRQYIEFGTWKGTVAQMLADDRCPVGANVRTAHEERGIEGVQQTFEGLKMMGAKAEITVRPKTEIEYTLAGAPEPKKKVI